MAFKFSDAVVARFKDLGILSAEIKCYIADDNNKWVDFTDKEEINGTNRLINLGAVTHATESQEATGAFHTTTQDIIMDNSDNFWDSPLIGLSTVEGITAVFGSTEYAQMSIFYRHRIKIAVMIQMAEGTPVETPVGIFLIEDIFFNPNKTVSIKTVGLAKPLMEHSAEPVKDGISWYTNRPIKFLVEELLKQEYGEIRGASGNNRWRIPQSFILPDDITLPTADGERTSSGFGRAPEWDGTEWRNDGLICRALLWSHDIIGASQIGAKDALYLGCDDQLWKYSPSTDKYTVLDNTTLGSTYKIRRLWYNDNFNYNIYGFATTVPSSTSRVVSGRIFRFDGTSITIMSTMTDVFVGDFTIRLGDDNGVAPPNTQSIVGDPQTGSLNADCGDNMWIPFSQYMISMASGAVPIYGKTVPEPSGAANLSGNNYNIGSSAGDGITVKSGYYAAGVLVNPAAFGMKFTYGQTGFLEYNNNAGVGVAEPQGVISWFSYDSSDVKYYLNSYDLGDDDITSEIWSLEGSGYYWMPLCGCSHASDDKFFFTCIGYVEDEASGTNQTSVRVFVYDTSAGTVTEKANWVTEEVPLEMLYVPNDPASKSVYYSYFNGDWKNSDISNKPAKYGISKMDESTGDISNITTRAWHPKGLVLGSTGDSGGTSGDVYFTNVGPNSLSRLIVDDETVESLDFGWPVVDGDTNLSSNLVIDSDTRSGLNSNIIYGNSAPYYPEETQDPNDVPVGKYYLWKFDSLYSGRIELADFEGMKIWDALQDLTQIANHVMGFTTEGDFFFIPRSISETADFTLKIDDPTDNVIESINKNLGYKEIYNYCSITPNKAVVQEPKSEFIIKSRNTPLDSRYTVDQRDSLKKNIRAGCIQEGTIIDKDAYFKWLTYNRPIEALITQSYTQGDTTLYLASVFGGDTEENGVHINDYLQVINPLNNREVVVRITGVSTANNSITISDSDGDALPSIEPETQCLILKESQLSSATTTASLNRKKWSNEGVTFVSKGYNNNYQELNSLDEISLQTVVRFGNSGQYARVASINTASNIIYLKDPDASVAQSPNLTVNVSTNDVVYAFYSPMYNGTNGDTDFHEIGGTNVHVRWETKSGGDNSFKRGDAFYIECPGLKLQSEDESKQVFMNSNSVLKFKRREFPSISNKFFDKKMARDFARKIINEYYNPKYILTVKSILLPYVNFVNDSDANLRIDVQDSFNFRNRRLHTEKCLPRKIVHDVTNFKSTFILKGKDFY
jgi:hypothetical protein